MRIFPIKNISEIIKLFTGIDYNEKIDYMNMRKIILKIMSVKHNNTIEEGIKAQENRILVMLFVMMSSMCLKITNGCIK